MCNVDVRKREWGEKKCVCVCVRERRGREREKERVCVCNFEQGIETGLEVELKFSHALKTCNPLKLENKNKTWPYL